ncbi:YjjG family noncanonical pyrimidine nucleotidase [Salinispira pacifica]|uniref:5'-nucleotidase YjjG n=1 Tax=Salinispira pacifica TaxID=1307761 RepID=V5WH74_9SPIO|nr:YjjG family noncanonical pyrimidine nucleotidase [Salinispira pacifica]AHC14975.1 5'-nucleotidase YjjG [Salinispira pacifica]
MQPKFDWLLFDADHTLLDFDASEAHAFRSACTRMELEYQESWFPVYKNINRRLWQDLEQGRISSGELRLQRFQQFCDALPRDALSSDPDAHRFSACFLEELQNTAHLMEGAEEILRNLRPHFSLAIISNGIRETQHKRLERTGLKPLFQHIIVSEDAGAAKPDPAFFTHTFSLLGSPLNRERMLVIGDNLGSDILGANRAGLPSCWFNPGNAENPGTAKHDFEIQNLSQLAEIVFAE